MEGCAAAEVPPIISGLSRLSPKLSMPLVVALAEVPDSRPRTRSASHRRLQSRVGRVLAREAAARLNQRCSAEFEIAGGGDSRPVLVCNPAHGDSTTIAISHSGRWVSAAAAPGQYRLGIDVQVIEPRDVARLAGFMNWTGLLGAPAGDSAREQGRFTHLWTLWEAAVKCNGSTLLADVVPAFNSLAPHCRPGTGQSWAAGGYWAHSRPLDDLHWLTVVVATPMSPSLDVHCVKAPLALPRQA
jgi:phosphopantetheinyl transferase